MGLETTSPSNVELGKRSNARNSTDCDINRRMKMSREEGSDDIKDNLEARLINLTVEFAKLVKEQSEEAQRVARNRMAGMAVFYGLFFVLVNAFVGLTRMILESGSQYAIDYYLLLFVFSLSQSLVGYMIVFESRRANYPKAFQTALILVLVSLPQLFLLIFGLLLGFDRILVIAGLFFNLLIGGVVARQQRGVD